MTETTLRTETDRQEFCDAYFESVGSTVICKADGYREYELPRDVDKEMTDRPYYWMWVEKTNQVVQPSVLRLAFTESALKRENERLRSEALAKAEAQGMNDIQRMYFRPPTCEFVTLGSYRLEKICNSLEKRGQFAAVMPKYAAPGTRLVPWLMANLRVSHRCDLVEQMFVSVGVCLSNGQVVDRFFDMIRKIEMRPMNPMPNIDVRQFQNGFARIRDYLETKLSNTSHEWAEEAQARLNEELLQVRTYYTSILPDTPPAEHALIEAECARKVAELKERTQPRIEIQLRQVALVGLMER